MAYRLVKVEELADYWLVAHMVGYGAEAVILRSTCHVVLAVVRRGVSEFHAMLRLQLNCATVPLIVARPMMGTIPFFSLLPFA